jgi:NAD(P)-dependent dehydrogenase (short-subunit alcohol dehydrogenase family)
MSEQSLYINRAGMPGLSSYPAAKWAVGGFTEVMARELTRIAGFLRRDSR